MASTLEPTRHKRRSDPTPVLEVSSPPCRTHIHSGGWEYPLSREEKKKRVMQLYQAELEARDSREQSFEASEGVPSSPSGASDSVDVSDAAAQTLVSNAPSSRFATALATLLIVLVLLALLWVKSSAWQDGSDSNTHCRVPDNMSSQPEPMNRSLTVNATAAPANSDRVALVMPSVMLGVSLSNVTATVRRMQTMGHERLKHSDCPEAVLWFSSALELLRSNTSTNLTLVDRARLEANRGFALICAQKYTEGANELEQHLFANAELLTGETHLVNALGYAHFKMQDFMRAAEIFAAGTDVDPLNMILWNNLAAAKMAHGDLQAADDAMFNAAEMYERVSATVDAYREGLIFDNVMLLSEKIQGNNHTRLPVVELWIP